MKEYRSLAEWLESEGSPKHHIANGENGRMIVAIQDDSHGTVTIHSFKETKYPNGQTSLWIDTGTCIRREYLPAIKGLLNNEIANEVSETETMIYLVVIWLDDEEGECEAVIDTLNVYTEAHARLVLRNGLISGKYPKGAWLERKGGK